MQKTRILICAVIFLLGGILCANAGMTRDQALHEFVKGGIAYKDGDYQEAIRTYENVIHQGITSGPLYYNLGNSYFKIGKVGKAILNYRRAMQLIPRDGDLNSNYKYIDTQIRKKISSAKPFFAVSVGEYLTKHFTVNELVIFLYFFGVSIMLIHIFSLYFRWPKRIRWSLLIIFTFIFLVSSLSLMFKIDSERNTAIVISDSETKFEPSPGATKHFDLHEGAEVKILKLDGLWLKIKRRDDKIGWTRQENIEKI